MEHEVKFQFEVIETFIEIRHVTTEGALSAKVSNALNPQQWCPVLHCLPDYTDS